MRTILYNLRNVGNEVVLSIDLTSKIVSENSESIIVDLPTGQSTIKKAQWINKGKIYEVDSKLFFIIASKQLSRKYAFEVLMNHSIGKISNRIAKLEALKKEYQLQVA